MISNKQIGYAFKTLLQISLLLLHHSCTSPAEEKSKITSTTYVVTHVIDGDTFWAKNKTQKVKVRLIGIDAPEMRTGYNDVLNEAGVIARNFLESLILKKEIKMEYDIDTKDRHGRTLAYVFLNDGTFVNAELLKNGYARTLTVPPNVKYADVFSQLQKEAIIQKKGLWASAPDDLRK
ncbi:MAG: thermonuclease family protein [Chitinophagales bacterium]|nr:thermonuclease family protein [Chitinophagales bacterium]